METSPTRVLIVGAGSTGLTTAVELARQGIVADVVEKRVSPSGLSRAVGLLPAAMEVFAKSAAGEAIFSEAVAIQYARFHIGDRRLTKISLTGDPNVHQRVFGLPQDRTEFHLRQTFKAQGGSVKFGHELIDVKQHDDHVLASVSSNNGTFDERYDYVVGADGINSRVREILGIEFAGYDLAEQWSIADVDYVNWEAPEQFSIYLNGYGKVVIVVPLEKQRYRVVSNTSDALAAIPVLFEPNKIRREAQFTISIRQAVEYSINRVALVGDAAHAHSPVGGRGMNLGIVDAAMLAQCIVQNDLPSYSRSRYSEGQRIIRFTERARSIITSNNSVTRGILKVVLKVMGKSTGLHNFLARRIMSL